jgi:hypothetical protein
MHRSKGRGYLLDHLVGEREQLVRNLEPKLLGRPEAPGLPGRFRIGRVIGNRAIIEGLRIDIVEIGNLNQRVIAPATAAASIRTGADPGSCDLGDCTQHPFVSIHPFERFSRWREELRIAADCFTLS